MWKYFMMLFDISSLSITYMRPYIEISVKETLIYLEELLCSSILIR